MRRRTAPIALALATVTALLPGSAVAAGSAGGVRVEATRVIADAGFTVSLHQPNERGEVPVNAAAGIENRAYVVRGDRARRLDTSGGGAVRDIDDRGIAVGVQNLETTDGTLRAGPVFWRGAVRHPIAQPEGRSLAATSINERGEIVLASLAALDSGAPLLRSPGGRLTPIEVPGGATAFVPTSLTNDARALTDDGRVLALTAETFPAVGFHGYVWRDGAVVADVGPGTLATHITDSGYVAGTLYAGDGTSPFLWRDGVLRRLAGPDGGFASMTDVNEAGDVAGITDRADGARRGVLWRAGGAPRELPTLGGTNSVATTVDDRGVVAGRAEDAQGRSHPVFWVGGRVVDLGLPAGATEGVALQITPDGAVYGTVTRPSGTGTTTDVYRWCLNR